MNNLYKEFIGKFIGLNKIRKVIDVEEKTFLGSKKVSLEYKGGADPEVYPLRMLGNMVTKDKSDLTKLREARVVAVIEDIIRILTESELTKPEIDFAVGPRLMESLLDGMKRAEAILWNKPEYEITLKDVNDVLTRSIDKKES